jgi:hypothetical protein
MGAAPGTQPCEMLPAFASFLILFCLERCLKLTASKEGGCPWTADLGQSHKCCWSLPSLILLCLEGVNDADTYQCVRRA